MPDGVTKKLLLSKTRNNQQNNIKIMPLKRSCYILFRPWERAVYRLDDDDGDDGMNRRRDALVPVRRGAAFIAAFFGG
jgi:hypothetical protein